MSGIDNDQNELYQGRNQLRQDTSDLWEEMDRRLRATNLPDPERDHLRAGLTAVNNLIDLQEHRDRTPTEWANRSAQDDLTFEYLRQTEMQDRGRVVAFLQAENNVYAQMINNASAARQTADGEIKQASAAMLQASEHPAKAAAELQKATERFQSAQEKLRPYEGREHQYRNDRRYIRLAESYNERLAAYRAAQTNQADAANATQRYNAAKTVYDGAKARYDTANTQLTEAQSKYAENRAIADRITRIGALEDKLGRTYDTLGNELMADTKRKHKWSANQVRSVQESGGQSIQRLKEVRNDKYQYMFDNQGYMLAQDGQRMVDFRTQQPMYRARNNYEQMAITAALSEKYQTANCGENANWEAIEAMHRFNRANIPIGIKSHDADHAMFYMGRFGYRECRVQDTWPPDSTESINVERYNLTTLHRQQVAFEGVTNSPFNYLEHAKNNLIHDAPSAREHFGPVKPFRSRAETTAWVRTNEYPYRSHLYNITRAEHLDGYQSDATGVTITSNGLRNPMSSPPWSSSEQYPNSSSNSNSNSNGGAQWRGMRDLSQDMDRLSMSPGSAEPAAGQRFSPGGNAYMTNAPVASPSNSGYNASSERSSSTGDSGSDRGRRSDAPSPTSSTTSMRANPSSQYASLPSSSGPPRESHASRSETHHEKPKAGTGKKPRKRS
ncbi:hypothetical protein [Actinoplanes sp. NPDC049599]|uniref:hypothetical protein n=1 Tax=Actinoplanes sp. NPDC049599 TaxID=3363903 RepID=UPI0037ADEDC0